MLVLFTRSSMVMAGSAQRARIVLLAADGVSNTEIASRTGVSRPTVIAWARYKESGISGFVDRPAQVGSTSPSGPRRRHSQRANRRTSQVAVGIPWLRT
jgi:transposase